MAIIRNDPNKDNPSPHSLEESPSFAYTVGIPATLLDDPSLTDRQLRLMIHLIGLARKEGYCWASDRYLSKKMNVSISQIQKELQALEKSGWIVRNTTREGMKSIRSIYVAPAFSKNPYECSRSSSGGYTPAGVPGIRPAEVPIYKAINILKKKELPKGSKKDVAVAPSPLISFGEFKRIKLTQKDYDDLEGRFGKEKLQVLITDVDGNYEERGVTRKNYKASILNWERREKTMNPQSKRESLQEKNKAYSEEAVKKLRTQLIPKDVILEVRSEYIELGSTKHPSRKHLKFSEHGFKDRLDSLLRRMDLIKYLT